MSYNVDALVASYAAKTDTMPTMEAYSRFWQWEQRAKIMEAEQAEKDRKSAVDYAKYEVEYRYRHQDNAFHPDKAVREKYLGEWRSFHLCLLRYEEQFAGTPTFDKMREAAHAMDVKMRADRARSDKWADERRKAAADRERVLAGLIAEKMRDMPGATREEVLDAIADDRRQKWADDEAAMCKRYADAEEHYRRAREQRDREEAARRAAGPPTLRQRAAAYEADWADHDAKVAAYKRSLHEEAQADWRRNNPEEARAADESHSYFEERRALREDYERRRDEATLAHIPGSGTGWVEEMAIEYEAKCERLEREHVQRLRGGCCG